MQKMLTQKYNTSVSNSFSTPDLNITQALSGFSQSPTTVNSLLYIVASD